MFDVKVGGYVVNCVVVYDEVFGEHGGVIGHMAYLEYGMDFRRNDGVDLWSWAMRLAEQRVFPWLDDDMVLYVRV